MSNTTTGSSNDDGTTTDWNDALIGVALAFFATIFSTVANVIIKYTTMQNERRPVHQQRHVCKQPLWWVVFGMYIANGGLDFAAYAFASISVVAPISALTIVINVIAAYFILHERISRREAFGSLILTAGAILAVFSGSREEPEEDVEGIKRLFRRTPFIIFTLCKIGIILISAWIVFLSPHARKMKRQHKAYVEEMQLWSQMQQDKAATAAARAPVAAATAATNAPVHQTTQFQPLPKGPPDLVSETKQSTVTTSLPVATTVAALPPARASVEMSSLPPATVSFKPLVPSQHQPQQQQSSLPVGGTVLGALKASSTSSSSTSDCATASISSASTTTTTSTSTSTNSSNTGSTGLAADDDAPAIAALWSPRGKKPPAPFAAPPSPPQAPSPPPMIFNDNDDDGVQLVGGGNGGGWTITVDSDPNDIGVGEEKEDPLAAKELAIHFDAPSSSEPSTPTQRLTLVRSNSEDRGKPLPTIPPSPLLASMAHELGAPLPLSTAAAPSEPLRTSSEIDWVESMPSVHLTIVTADGSPLIESTEVTSDSMAYMDEPSPMVNGKGGRLRRAYSASGRPLPFAVKKNVKYAIRMVAYALLQSSWGSWTNMFAKAAVVLISGSTSGDDQTSNFLFWLCVVATIVCAVLQLKLLSGMLNAFDAVSVIPVYQTLFIFNLILTGGIFFEEFSDDYLNSYNIFVFAAAIVIVIIGIIIMTTIHKDGPEGVGAAAAVAHGQQMSPRHNAHHPHQAAINQPEKVPTLPGTTAPKDTAATTVPSVVIPMPKGPPPMTPLAV